MMGNSLGARQGPPQGIQPEPPPHGGPLIVHKVAPTVYWVEGGIGNCGFVVGDNGVIVIDATISPESGKKFLSNIAKITPKPVTTVILTHGDFDHVGGLAAFPTGFTIIAHENNKKCMEAAVAAGQCIISADHLPDRAVIKDREAVESDGGEIGVFPLGSSAYGR